MTNLEDGIQYELANCELMRLDLDDTHYYYGSETGGEKKFYVGVTTVLDVAGPFPQGLREYLRVTSYEDQKERLQFTGDRGSKLHEALDLLMRRQELDLKQNYASEYEKSAVVAFIRMMRFLTPGKYNTELIVADPALRVAGTLDFRGFVDAWKLACLLDPMKYLDTDSDGDFQLKERWVNLPDNKKRVNIVIDWKFVGRNAYNHKVQVAAYKTQYNKSYTGRMVSRAFTWRYSQHHKHGFDFSESFLDYNSFKRLYSTYIEFLGEFPSPPTIKRFPDRIRLYDEVKK